MEVYTLMHMKIPLKPEKHNFEGSTDRNSDPIDQEWTQKYTFEQNPSDFHVGDVKENFCTR